MSYVQYGCGFSAGEGWVNFDSSPTLRIERLPIGGPFISGKLSGNSRRFPDSVLYGDIRKGVLVPVGSAAGVYASHVLEHMSLEDLRAALRNTCLMLQSGGIFRLIVPDLRARAKQYVSAADDDPDAAPRFIRATLLGMEVRKASLFGKVREAFGNSQHLWMWDEPSLTAELNDAGFSNIRRCDFGDSKDRMFDRVESYDRFYDATLGVRECALEAHKY